MALAIPCIVLCLALVAAALFASGWGSVGCLAAFALLSAGVAHVYTRAIERGWVDLVRVG